MKNHKPIQTKTTLDSTPITHSGLAGCHLTEKAYTFLYHNHFMDATDKSFLNMKKTFKTVCKHRHTEESNNFKYGKKPLKFEGKHTQSQKRTPRQIAIV